MKNETNNEEFGILLFTRRDIDEIFIPSNIKIIGSFSSSESSIIKIFIPSNVTKICENAFSYCNKFQIAEIYEESKLQSILKSAFEGYSKLIILIPISMKKIYQTISRT